MIPTATIQPVHVILCVDDDAPGLRARTAVLLTAGYQVIPATSAEEALETFTKQHVDLVMTDNLLQSTTGFEVAKQMKSLRPDVPIVVFSGELLTMDDVQSESVDLLLSKGAGQTEMLVRLSLLLKL